MRITGLGEHLPGPPVTNAELAQLFGLHERWLATMTGNRTRYYCGWGGEEPTTVTDIAAAAGQAALDQARVAPRDLDFVVLATASPDELMPATVNRVLDRLLINDVPALQLASGCAGALQALFVARSLLAGGLERGLVIGADSCRQMWAAAPRATDMHPSEMINFAMFGDGAGAAVVQSGTAGPGLVVEELFVRSSGLDREPGQVVRWYGGAGAPMVDDRRRGRVREAMATEDYKAIEREVPRAARLILDELLARTGWSLDEVEHVLTPQLNGVMTERVRDFLGVREEQAVSCVADTGNNGNGLPFIQLARARRLLTGRPDPSARLLLCAVESSKWIHTGMALRYRAGAAA
jgi:3-oxoacyl-[acyl-carrier-protein] synthase-3